VGGEVDQVGGTFLMLDHLGPTEYGPGEALGAPTHPHRGFETVTVILQGGMEHKDSVGNHGHLKPGMVQWMTAGRGVVHSEMPSADLLENGGTLEGFQLWVNLPRAKKMSPPRYQDIPAENIPTVAIPGGKPDSTVRVIAGSSCGASAVIETATPIQMLDIRIEPGDGFTQPFPKGQVGFAYVYRGKGLFGKEQKLAEESQMVQFSDGESVAIAAPADSPLKCLLITGDPIEEPIVRHGPFVMNTREEIMQAFVDYQSGQFGEIEGTEEQMALSEQARQKQKASGTWKDDL
jgi:hypothetical protein